MVLENELKRLITEIILVCFFLLIMIPLCSNAASRHQSKKEFMLAHNKASVDISFTDNGRVLTISNLVKKKNVVKLVLKINRAGDDYLVYIDDNVYSLNGLNYSFDSDFYYYDFGTYEINGSRSFKIDFVNKSVVGDNDIVYSFITEELG